MYFPAGYWASYVPSAAATLTGGPTIRTGLNTFWPLSFAKGRNGDLYGVNGIDRGLRWDGLTAATEELGLDAPLAAPTASTPGSGGATAGDYLLLYRYVDDTLPDGIPSSMSADLIVTAANSDKFVWATLVASTHARAKYIELWRSTSGEADVVYFIKRLGGSGTITGITNVAATSYTITSANHGLAVGAILTISGVVGTGNMATDLNTTGLEVTAVTTNTFTVLDGTASGTYTSGGAWTLTGYNADTATDDTISDVAEEFIIPIYTEAGEVNARRFVPPPDWTPFIEQFQDRTWHFGAVKYTAGTVSTTATSATITGSGTAWTAQMAGRYIYIAGLSAPLVIQSASATSITATTAAPSSLAGVTYCIMPDPAYRDSAFFSEVDEPESVPLTNEVKIQNNTGDDDDVTGGHAFGSRFIFTKERHLYSMGYNAQPTIDAGIHLLASRGALNNRCFVFYGDNAYAMDAQGPYMLAGGGIDPNFGNAVQQYFVDGTLDMHYAKWFHITVDYLRELVCFHVVFASDVDDLSLVRPRKAFVFNGQTGEWTLDSYSHQVGAGCIAPIQGQPYRFLGGETSIIYVGDTGFADFLSAPVRHNVTATLGLGRIDDTTNSPFVASMQWCPVAIIDGPGKGQVSRIISVDSSSSVSVSPSWSITPTVDSVYEVAAVAAVYRTGILDCPRSENYQKRSARLCYNPTLTDSPLFVRVIQNHSASALAARISDDAGVGVTTTIDSSYQAMNIKLARSAQGDDPGFKEFGFSGVGNDRGQGMRYVSVEIVAFGGVEQVSINELAIDGA